MYCKQCGQPINPGAAACMHCGFAVGTGNNYCANCGSQITPGQAVCINCGAPLVAAVQQTAFNPADQKSKLTAALLAFLLGSIGVHNFYLGFTGKAIGQIALSFLCGIGYIWAIVDGIMILTGKIDKDAKGVPLKD